MPKPIWTKRRLTSSAGVEKVERRGPNQQDSWVEVDPQPEVMVIVVDEADPHANERGSYSGQYGVLYCLRTDNVEDKDRFWFQPHMDGKPVGQRFVWGVVGADRWNIDHALSGVNYGVKMFRVRRGG